MLKLTIARFQTKFYQIGIILLLLVLTFAYFLFSGNSLQAVETVVAEPLLADVYVAEGRPELSEPNHKFMWVGYDQSGKFLKQRTLLKFNLGGIQPGSIVRTATLNMTLARATGAASTMNVTVARITGGTDDWPNDPSEAMTWQRHLQLQSTTANAQTIAVSTERKSYEWQLTQLVQDWVNSNPRTTYLALLVSSDETIGQHERGFWTKDCNPAECGTGVTPTLNVQFEPPPTATPISTPTVTPTHTPTPLPTPTSAVKVLNLDNNPTGSIGVGDEINYVIAYRTIETGTFQLDDVVITATIPNHVVLITESLQISTAFQVTYTNINPTGLVIWEFTEPLLPDEGGAVSYRVIRPGPIPEIAPTALATTVPDVIIQNNGVIMAWTYEGERQTKRSNSSYNPPPKLFLPIVAR